MATEERTICFKGVDLDCNFFFQKACPGAREKGSGLQLEPDESASVELRSVTLGNQDLSDLVEPHWPEIEAQILEERSNDDSE